MSQKFMTFTDVGDNCTSDSMRWVIGLRSFGKINAWKTVSRGLFMVVFRERF